MLLSKRKKEAGVDLIVYPSWKINRKEGFFFVFVLTYIFYSDKVVLALKS